MSVWADGMNTKVLVVDGTILVVVIRRCYSLDQTACSMLVVVIERSSVAEVQMRIV